MNPQDKFTASISFQITFEVVQAILEDIEFKIIYVGSSSSVSYDQVLDSIMVGPVPLGTSQFVLETPCPDYMKSPHQDLIGLFD